MEIKKLVNEAYNTLIADLKNGDEIIVSGSYDRPLRMSKKTGEARVGFLEKVRTLLIAKEITVDEANKAIHLFGKKTTALYWCRKTNLLQ